MLGKASPGHSHILWGRCCLLASHARCSIRVGLMGRAACPGGLTWFPPQWHSGHLAAKIPLESLRPGGPRWVTNAGRGKDTREDAGKCGWKSPPFGGAPGPPFLTGGWTLQYPAKGRALPAMLMQEALAKGGSQRNRTPRVTDLWVLESAGLSACGTSYRAPGYVTPLGRQGGDRSRTQPGASLPLPVCLCRPPLSLPCSKTPPLPMTSK